MTGKVVVQRPGKVSTGTDELSSVWSRVTAAPPMVSSAPEALVTVTVDGDGSSGRVIVHGRSSTRSSRSPTSTWVVCGVGVVPSVAAGGRGEDDADLARHADR